MSASKYFRYGIVSSVIISQSWVLAQQFTTISFVAYPIHKAAYAESLVYCSSLKSKSDRYDEIKNCLRARHSRHWDASELKAGLSEIRSRCKIKGSLARAWVRPSEENESCLVMNIQLWAKYWQDEHKPKNNFANFVNLLLRGAIHQTARFPSESVISDSDSSSTVGSEHSEAPKLIAEIQKQREANQKTRDEEDHLRKNWEGPKLTVSNLKTLRDEMRDKPQLNSVESWIAFPEKFVSLTRVPSSSCSTNTSIQGHDSSLSKSGTIGSSGSGEIPSTATSRSNSSFGSVLPVKN